MALILRNGGSQSPGRWLRDPRNNHKEEIESEYELLVPQEKLSEYSNWNEIFEFAKCSWKFFLEET